MLHCCGALTTAIQRVVCGSDEMGLGKTVTMIGLFVHNAANHIPRIPSRQGQFTSLYVVVVVGSIMLLYLCGKIALDSIIPLYFCLECFAAVGLAAGKASGL